MLCGLACAYANLTAQLIAKNLSVAPELTIRPGYRFNVVVVKDLVLLKSGVMEHGGIWNWML